MLAERLLAGSDDCSDTALGRKWLSRALHSHAASVSAASKGDAGGRSQGVCVLHHQLQPLHADSAVCVCNGNHCNNRESKYLGHQILCCSASGFTSHNE